MKLDFLEDGSLERPLVRLYAFDVTEAARLRDSALSLSSWACASVALHSAPGVEPVRDCRLTWRLGEADLGTVRRGLSEFDCVLSPAGWDHVALLLEPFCESAAPGHYQWLTEWGDAELLLSPDGHW